MNVVFWLSIVTALVLVWFLLSFAFGSIGTLFYRLFSDAKSVVASNFQRSYRARAQSEREFAALPEDVKKFATALGASLSLDQSPHKVEEPKAALPQDTKTRTVEAVQNFEKALSALKNERAKQEKKPPVQKQEPKRELTEEEQVMMDRWTERRKVAGISD